MFIILNDRFSASRDSHGWTLTETQQKMRLRALPPKGKFRGCKKGDDYTVTNQTYFGSLQHLCASVIDKAAGAEEVSSVMDMLDAINKAAEECVVAIAKARMDRQG